MRRIVAIAGSAVFLVLAPGTVAGVIPWWISRWQIAEPFLGMPFIRYAGAVLVAFGAAGLLDSFFRFAIQGLGTPAPVFPTKHLVVSGLYRYVRNPMYAAVVSAILGQALVLGNTGLLAYGVVVWLFTFMFVLSYEEPTLRATFGSEYEVYCRAVHRWIPRMRPWQAMR